MTLPERHLITLLILLAVCTSGNSTPAAHQHRSDPQTSNAVALDTSTHHYEYVFREGSISVYDIDSNHTLQKVVHVSQTQSQGIRGEAVSPSSGMLYLSYGGDGGQYGNGSMLAYDLLRDTVLWTRSYSHGIDSHAITPDGTTIFMPEGELSGTGIWHVVSAADGSEIGSIQTHGTGPHNTVMSLDGSHVYMGERDLSNLGHDSLYVASTRPPYSITKSVGKTLSGVRPFTVDGAEAYAFVGITGLLGFQVLDLKRDTVLWTIDLTTMGFPKTPCGLCPTAPSHGISLSPDEKELYVVDQPNSYIHVFDVTGTLGQGSVPVKVADIALAHQLSGTDSACAYDCTRSGWLHLSIDGRYAYVGESGDVIDTHSRTIVAYLPSLRDTKQMLEIDFRMGKVVATSTRTSVGKLLGALSPAAPSLAAPPSGAQNQLTTLLLKWNPSAGATSYRLQVAIDSLFLLPTIDDSSLTSTSVTINSLLVLTRYFWRVNAHNLNGASGWSSAWSFTTLPAGARIFDYAASWNLIALPLQPADSLASVLFPTASAAPFTYRNGAYVQAETLHVGTAYWLPFSSPQAIAFVGTTLAVDTVRAAKGWNMIGGLSTPLAAHSIGGLPPGLITSEFFGYSPGGEYVVADSLLPSQGYWVKVDTPGALIFSSAGGAPSTLINIRSIGTERPPDPPFSSGTGVGNEPNVGRSFQFRLEQNFPNPFNPSTVIRYDIPSAGLVTLKIYDILGREVATLVDGERRDAGEYSVRWDGSNAPSGVYFSRLTSGTLTETRKLLLMK